MVRTFNRELWVEGTLYVGVIALGLAVIAFFRSRESENQNMLKLMLWGGLLALILAMGIDLHWNGQSVMIRLPQFLANIIYRTETPIPLPGYLMFYYFPFYAKLRALMRFGIFVLVFISAAAGFGSSWLINKAANRWKIPLTGLLMMLILFDFYPGPFQTFTQINARPVDYWLQSQPDQGPVVQMPFSLAEDQEQTYYTLIHEKPYVGGFFNAFPPEQYARIKPVLDQFPDQSSIDLLHKLGVKYVLVAVDDYPDPKATIEKIEGFGLKYLIQLDDQVVFEINDYDNQ